jgi:hypothetical protein
MPARRVLYLTSRQLYACNWRGGRLSHDATFETREEGLAEFEKYVAGDTAALYYLVADVVEEDYAQESIPLVRGGDRRTLLSRKIAQRFRDTSLAMSLSLGVQRGERREERVLFSSFTNTQQFHPWLNVLAAKEVKLAGVFSVSLAAPLVAKGLGLKHDSMLVVSLHEAGLRQTFIEGGRLRFSRLGRAEAASPRALADTVVAETVRLHQYLTSLRILSRESGAMPVLMIAPAGQLGVFEEACRAGSRPGALQLSYEVFDADEAARKIGLKGAPGELGSEKLFLHSLAAAAMPPMQFAAAPLRRFYHLWLARNGLFAGAVAMLMLCGLVAGYTWLDARSVEAAALADRQSESSEAQRYARIQANFPKSPLSAENLRTLVKNYQAVQKQTAMPEELLTIISQLLSNSPQLELERVNWLITSDLRAFNAKDTAKAAPAPAATAGSGAKAGEDRYQVAEMFGKINVAQASDYRNITDTVNRFVDGLRERKGVQVVATRLPFDITAETSLQGDIGTERKTAPPQFSVVVARRIGQ